MSRFDRIWMLKLQTDKEKFCNAFYDVVYKDANKMILRNASFGNSIDKDFFGTLCNETFTVWKRKGILDLNSTGLILDGKMIADKNYLTLELQIQNNLAFNYIKLFINAILFTLIIFFLSTRLISLISPISDTSFTIYSFTTIPVLFILIFYLQLKIIDKYLDRLKELYNEILERIEQQANSK